MNRGKTMRSFRLSARVQALLELLAERHGMSQTQVLEEAVKDKARRERVTLPAAVSSEGEEEGELLEMLK